MFLRDNTVLYQTPEQEDRWEISDDLHRGYNSEEIDEDVFPLNNLPQQ